MQTRLPEALLATERGRRAESILRACVHCGFCNATCPTYQMLGDELDGPRGRIYQIKDFLESSVASDRLNTHLDRCLTCRACETTCPSGVRYGELLEIAREEVPDDRTLWQRTIIAALKFFVPRRGLFRWVVAAGNLARPLLPKQLAEQVPPLRMANPPSRRSGARTKTRRVILLQGCVQSVSAPGTNAHLEALLDRHGIEVIQLPREGCCGSLALHLGDEHAAIEAMRHNVRLIAPMLSHVEAVISTASGCGVTVKDYGRLLADTPEADAGREFAAKTRDAGEYLAHAGIEVSAAREERRVAWHAPCTLQHGQKSRGHVESLLTAAGYQLTAVTDPHLCCGSAGTYSILQPALSTRLRDNKLSALQSDGPELIATANIGCQLHLASAAQLPVVHWVQLLR